MLFVRLIIPLVKSVFSGRLRLIVAAVGSHALRRRGPWLSGKGDGGFAS